MSLFESSTFYLCLSFLGFIGLIFRYAYRPFIQFLDAYIIKVKQSLHQAEEKKEKAEQLLHQENLKLLAVEHEIAELLKAAEQQCQTLRNNIQAEILAETKAQEHRLKILMNKMNHDFVCQLNDQVSEKILQAVKEWVGNHQTDILQEKSQQQAISLLQNLKIVKRDSSNREG